MWSSAVLHTWERMPSSIWYLSVWQVGVTWYLTLSAWFVVWCRSSKESDRMVNKHGESQCETGRGSRQMPRRLLPSLFDNVHCSLINPPSSMSLTAYPWRTRVCWPRSEKGPVSLCVCSVVVRKYTSSAGSNAKGQDGQGYSEQQSSPSCS